MAVADGTVLRAVAQFTLPDSVIAQNVFYCVFADTGGSNDEQDVVDDITEWLVDAYARLNTYIEADVSFDQVKVYEYDAGDDDWDEVGIGVASDAFAGSGSMAPHGVAALVHAYTSDPDVIGSKYIPGIRSDSINESDLTAAILTALALFAGDWTAPFVGTLTGGDLGPGVWSVAQTVFKLFNEIEAINGQVAYQRRRKPGVGI